LVILETRSFGGLRDAAEIVPDLIKLYNLEMSFAVDLLYLQQTQN